MSVGIHPLVKVFSAREEICYGVGMSGDVVEAVIEVLEEFHPSGLVACDFLWLMEIL